MVSLGSGEVFAGLELEVRNQCVCTILTVSYEYHLFAYCNLFDISSNNIFFQAAQVMYEAFRAICADTTWDKGTWEKYLGKHVESSRSAFQYENLHCPSNAIVLTSALSPGCAPPSLTVLLQKTMRYAKESAGATSDKRARRYEFRAYVRKHYYVNDRP
eukprot:341777-Prorocentrum_minimum.AAC.3